MTESGKLTGPELAEKLRAELPDDFPSDEAREAYLLELNTIEYSDSSDTLFFGIYERPQREDGVIPALDRMPLGIERLDNIRRVILAGNQISDLSPLAKLDTLEILHISRIPVTNLTPLSNLANLRQLSLSGTQVTDLSPLAQLTGLRWLSLFDTQVADLSPLINNLELKIQFQSCRNLPRKLLHIAPDKNGSRVVVAREFYKQNC